MAPSVDCRYLVRLFAGLPLAVLALVFVRFDAAVRFTVALPLVFAAGIKPAFSTCRTQ
jgi:hypothetical protein